MIAKDEWTFSIAGALERIRAEGARRDTPGRPGTVRLNAISNTIGLFGEDGFAQAFPGLKVDYSPRPAGDNGIDFKAIFYNRHGIPDLFEVDVKTTPYKTGRLLVGVAACAPRRIYPLAIYCEASQTVRLVGWQIGRFIMGTTPTKTNADGPPNYCVERKELETMDLLRARYYGPLAQALPQRFSPNSLCASSVRF